MFKSLNPVNATFPPLSPNIRSFDFTLLLYYYVSLICMLILYRFCLYLYCILPLFKAFLCWPKETHFEVFYSMAFYGIIWIIDGMTSIVSNTLLRHFCSGRRCSFSRRLFSSISAPSSLSFRPKRKSR